jgi:Flp pilus assembly protein TadG
MTRQLQAKRNAMPATIPASRRSPGQSLVEFALIMPLLVAFLFGIIELGYLLNVYIGLTNSAREAARAGTLYQVSSPLTSTSDVTTADTQRLQFMSQVITDTISPAIDPVTELNVNVSYTPATPLTTNLYRSGDAISVQLSHPHQLFFGLLGPKTVNLQATSTMRIEQGGVQ